MLNTLKKVLIGLLAFFLVFIVAVYALSPVAVRYFAKSPLEGLGLQLSSDSQVRIHLLSASVIVSDLELLNDENETTARIDKLELSVSFWPSLFGDIVIDELSFDGGTLLVQQQQGAWQVAGVELSEQVGTVQADEQIESEEIETSASSSNRSIILAQADLRSLAVQINIEGNEHNYQVSSLQLSDVKLSPKAQSFNLTLASVLNDAVVGLNANVNLSQPTQQELHGTVQAKTRIEALALDRFSHFVEAMDVKLAGSLSANADTELVIDNSNIAVAVPEVEIHLNDLSANYQDWSYLGRQHNLSGNNLSLDVIDGELTLASLPLSIDLQEGAINRVSANQEEDSEQVEAQVFAEWQSVSLSPQIAFEQSIPAVNIPEIIVEQFAFSRLKDKEPMASLPSIMVKQLSLDNSHLSLGNIEIAGGTANVHLNEEGQLVHLVPFPSSSLDDEEEAEEVAEPQDNNPSEDPAFSFELGGFALTQPFMLKVVDESVEPDFERDLQVNQLEFGTLNSARPALLTPFVIVIDGDEYLHIEADGKVNPLSPVLSGELNSAVKELSLPDISPYMKDALGFEMKSGQLDMELSLNIEEGQLEGQTHLNSRGIEMTKADDYEQGTIKEGQAMPLNVALGLLKDSQGNIDLQVPVSGNINDPSFGLSHFASLVLKKAAMAKTKAYLMATFVPYSSVVSVVMTGAEHLLKLRLEPLPYQPGQTKLDDTQIKYVEQLALLMRDKPDLQIKTCAVSIRSERFDRGRDELSPAQTEALVELGAERQSTLKDYLVEVHQIASSRILACTPEIDMSESAIPRIELKTD